MMRIGSQRGDTLVEVAFAIAIVSVTLSVAYNLASRSFRLGQNAKELTQAVSLIQEQAEALRNMRDNYSRSGNTWAGFTTLVGLPNTCTAVSPCSIQRSGSNWVRSSSQTVGIFTISYVGTLFTASPDNGNRAQFDITASWAPLGSGPTNTTTITTYLVNVDGIAPLQ